MIGVPCWMSRLKSPGRGVSPVRREDSAYPVNARSGSGRHFRLPLILAEQPTSIVVLHFDKGQFPPVDGFWSLTMYDAAYFFVPNPLNRYTLSQGTNS